MNEKIGMYTTDEILEYMTDCEGPFLGRSMFDAIFGKIDALKQQLKDKDEKISKAIEYCLIEREDINGSKCDDILEILETNKED